MHLTEEIFLFNPTTVQFHWKVLVKFTGILNISHNWKKYSNKEVTTLLKKSIQTSKGPVVASRITFLMNRVCLENWPDRTDHVLVAEIYRIAFHSWSALGSKEEKQYQPGYCVWCMGSDCMQNGSEESWKLWCRRYCVWDQDENETETRKGRTKWILEWPTLREGWNYLE